MLRKLGFWKKNIDRLIKSGIEDNLLTIKDTFDTTEKHFLITGFKTSTKKDRIDLFFNKDLKDNLFIKSQETGKFVNRYVVYDIDMFKDCSNADVMKLYELFKLYSYKKEKLNESYQITFKELKSYLDMVDKSVSAGKGKRKIKNESYKDYNVFKKMILNPAIKYINDHTDIVVTILDEVRKKGEYELNGVKKEFVDVNTITFLIDNKTKVSSSLPVIHEISLEIGKSLESVNDMIVKTTQDLCNSGVKIEEAQVAVLYKVCKDIVLVKLVLWSTSREKNINDIGALAYRRIHDAVIKGNTKTLKASLQLEYTKVRDVIAKKEKTKNITLDKADLGNKELVEVYDLAKKWTTRITKEDVHAMKLALMEYHVFQIKAAANYAINVKSKEGKFISSFKYIKKCLDKKMFGDRESYAYMEKLKAGELEVSVDNQLSGVESFDTKNDEAFNFDTLRGRM